MTETLKNANQKTNAWLATHPIEWVVVCSVAGYVIGRVLRSALES